jgi:hypothetical protein
MGFTHPTDIVNRQNFGCKSLLSFSLFLVTPLFRVQLSSPEKPKQMDDTVML